MKRMRTPPHEDWRATRNGAGQWVIVDHLGQDPLRAADPLVRIEAVHLAAAAPRLRAALRWLVEDMHALELRPLHIRHRVRLNFAEVVLIESKAPWREALRLNALPQQELDLNQAA